MVVDTRESAPPITPNGDGPRPGPSENEPQGTQPGHASQASGVATDDQLPEGMGWFSDKSGGLWAAITTGFCVVVGGGAHLTLLSAGLGRNDSGHVRHWWPMFWLAVAAPALVVGGMVWAVAFWRRNNGDGWKSMRIGGAVAGATALALGALFAIAWMSNNGHQVEWQPVVGSALAMVALGSFGGYFLASRRARVGLAASFVLTFLLLFSFMLTLQLLATAANGASVTADGKTASDVLGDFIKDFRGDVALIVGFYFGSDAAISAVKIFKSKGENAAELSRMDRDIATPRPASAAANRSPAS